MSDARQAPIAVAREQRGFHFSCERIAYWFFRLNGCLILENFLIHHERRGREGTEIDILGVRFPHRSELALSGRPMADHEVFTKRSEKIDIIIADSKRGSCALNESWFNPELQNIERILFVIGIFPTKEVVENVAKKLYKDQEYDDEYRINFYSLGSEKDTSLAPVIQQLTWEEILQFIHYRFVTFDDYKRQHDQWEPTGKELFERAMDYREDPDQFIGYITSRLTR